MKEKLGKEGFIKFREMSLQCGITAYFKALIHLIKQSVEVDEEKQERLRKDIYKKIVELLTYYGLEFVHIEPDIEFPSYNFEETLLNKNYI